MIPRARVKYFKQENYYNFIGSNTNLPRDLFFGNFGTIEHNSTYYMYGLDKYDQGLVKDIKLKQNEIIVRVDTDKTREREISNLVKINMDKFLVYFNEVDDFGDDSISFAPRGIKIDYINLFDGYESKLLEEVKNIIKPMKHILNYKEFLNESLKEEEDDAFLSHKLIDKLITDELGKKNSYSGSADWGGLSVWTIKGSKFEGTFLVIDDDDKVILMTRTFNEEDETNTDEDLEVAETEDEIIKLVEKVKKLKNK